MDLKSESKIFVTIDDETSVGTNVERYYTKSSDKLILWSSALHDLTLETRYSLTAIVRGDAYQASATLKQMPKGKWVFHVIGEFEKINRRKEVRLPVNVEINLINNSGSRSAGSTIDISLNGMRLKSEAQLEQSEPCIIHLKDDSEGLLEIHGEILSKSLRHKKPEIYLYTARFSHMERKTKENLRRYITRLGSGG